MMVADTLGSAGCRRRGFERSDGHRTGTDYKLIDGRVAADKRVGIGRFSADAGIGERESAPHILRAIPSYEPRTQARQLCGTSPSAALVERPADASGRRHGHVHAVPR